MGGRVFRGDVSRYGAPLAANSSIWRIVSAALSGRLALPLLLASVTPSLIAFVLAAIESGGTGLRELLGQAGRWRFGIGWYAVAILLAPVIWVVSLALEILLGGRGSEVRLDFLIPIAAVGEEFGWRGYALPRLQGRIGALPASLIIGVIWAAWHLPYFTDLSIHVLPFWIDFGLFVVVLVSESVLATWIYNSTRGSVWPPCCSTTAFTWRRSSR